MGRKALVTGGNRGIGFATARALTELGLRVVIGARDISAGRDAAQAIGAEAVELDVSDLSSITVALDHIGPIDVLVNNAGVLKSANLLDDPDDFERCLSVMLRGPYHLIRLTSPVMEENGYGRIVNISSGWGAFSEGIGGPGGYGVAKAALNALTVACARSLPAALKINAMCPGWVRTRMGGGNASRSPEEGADTAVWLATLPENGPTGRFFRDRKEIAW